ncbi:hypothetical protein [Couchioplanes azureus]|uniref:hypothetical protein n=2 Tax=Couchioplanes caeruleus TaxID=56438 RepID=UPI00188A3DD5|nr:hypothetical protein [Couchioplanes caeruleus]
METAVVLWMTLLLAVAAAAAALALPRREGRRGLPAVRGGDAGRVRPALRRRDGRPAVATAADGEADRYADEVARAVVRAAEIAARRRADWERAQEGVDEAWAAFDAADRTARRCTAAAAFPILRQRRTRAEIADRERFLHRSAVAACRRKELSIAQLNEALAHRGGWNPRKHPVAQEAALRSAVREHRFAAYQAATQHERAAWEEAEKAAAALRTLRAEALAARLRAGRDLRPVGDPRPVGGRGRAGQWSPAEPVARPAATLTAH